MTLLFDEQLRGLCRTPHREHQQAVALAHIPARQRVLQTHGKLFGDLEKAANEERGCGVYIMRAKKRNTSAEAAQRLAMAMAADDSAASTNVAGNCAPAEFRAMLMLPLLLLLLPLSSS